MYKDLQFILFNLYPQKFTVRDKQNLSDMYYCSFFVIALRNFDFGIMQYHRIVVFIFLTKFVQHFDKSHHFT